MSKLKTITIDTDFDKVKYYRIIDSKTQKIIEEFHPQFLRTLYSDFQNVDKYVFILVRDIVQKFHLYE